MKRRFAIRSGASLFALAAAMIAAASAPAAVAGEPSSEVQSGQGVGASRATEAAVPPIAFTERRLKNGLRVFFARDASAPTAAIQVWYGVGSKDDPQARSGFAHLFEHMMFKATRDLKSEAFDRLTEDVGGTNNASTSDDFTNFFEVVPSNQVERVLWAEAERMSSLDVDQSNFTSERAVVEEELRQSYLANPYGRLLLGVRDASYDVHPYRRSTIGSIGDLEAAGLADVKRFHDTFYRPDNASLIVIGDVSAADLERWTDRYFAPIGDPDRPTPRVSVVEPPRTAPRERTIYAPGVPLPAVTISWAIPAASSPELAALRVADAVLSQGDASRLSHDLVYTDQIASSVNSDAGLNAQPSLFQVSAVLAAGKSLQDGERALLAEVARLGAEPVSPEELARAKNQLIASALLERESVEGRGFNLGRAIYLQGDPARANSDIQELEAVSAQSLREAAARFLPADRRVVVRYLDDSQRPAGTPAAPDLAERSPTVQAIALPADLTPAPAPAALPRTAPIPGPPRSVASPQVSEKVLANGLRVIIARTSDLPIVTVELTMRRGGGADPPGLAGRASLTTDLLTRGTTHRSASQIAAEIEAAGGALRSVTGYDTSTLAVSALADQLDVVVPLLADVARRPAFAPEELERLKRQKQDDLLVTLSQPGALAELIAAPAVFGGGAYGAVLDGTPASLKRLSRADVLAAYAESFRSDQAILVMTGDIAPETGFALAERSFGDWARPAAPPPPRPALAPARPSRTLVVDLPGAGQAAVLVAGRTIGRGDPLYYAVRAANGVLGGGYSARLNEEIRIKRGLSYGAGSRVDARTGVGLFTAAAQTKNASAAQTAALMRRLIADLASAPLTAQELAAREASLGGEIARSEQTSAGLAGVLTTAAVYGLPLRQVVEAPQAIEAVDVDQARQAAPLVVDPALATLIVVGDAKTFGPSLQPGAPGVEVVSAAALDLDDPALVRAARAPTPLSPAGAPRGPGAQIAQGALGAPGD